MGPHSLGPLLTIPPDWLADASAGGPGQRTVGEAGALSRTLAARPGLGSGHAGSGKVVHMQLLSRSTEALETVPEHMNSRCSGTHVKLFRLGGNDQILTLVASH